MCEHTGISPRGEFNIVWIQHHGSCTILWWKALEISLGELWGSLIVYDTLQDKTAASQVTVVKPIMLHQKGWTLLDLCANRRGSFHTWASCVGEDTGKTKTPIPPRRSLLAFMSHSLLLAHLSQNQLVAKQRFICHGHPLVPLPSAPGLFPCTSSAKHPLLLQMADCLSH